MVKSIVVTGATDGIGLAVVKGLITQGHNVIGVARNHEKAARILEEMPSDRLRFVYGDLSSLDEVRQIAAGIATMVSQTDDRLIAVIHVAGVVVTKRSLTVDGHERTFAVNHLAVHLLTRLLLPLLQKETGARVLVVSSMAHRWGYVHFHDVSLRHGYWLLP
ncbi:MAG: SDR family NAD(P)-dependent oxidoreductase, partial [bacterium]